MQTLNFSNSAGTIEIGTSAPYYLQVLDGISGLGTLAQEQRAPNQNGTTLINKVFDKRFVTITGYMKACDYDTLNSQKRLLQKIFNPMSDVEMTYSNETYSKKITLSTENAPKFTADKGRRYQIFTVNLVAYEPFLVDLEESTEEMSVTLKNLVFPLICEPDLEFETNGAETIAISNEGDIETPVEIYFYGPAENPKVINETTGEFIEVTKTLLDGEVLYINTQFGNKQVLFTDSSSVQSNAFGLINLDSEFFQLQKGNNVLSYSADSGTDTANVLINYSNKYIGF